MNNNIEKKRTNNNWFPPTINKLEKKIKKVFYFNNMNETFLRYLKYMRYDLAIQGGGLGILKKEVMGRKKANQENSGNIVLG